MAVADHNDIIFGIDFGSKHIRAAIYTRNEIVSVANSRNWTSKSTPTTFILHDNKDLVSDEILDFSDDNSIYTYGFQEHRRMVCMGSDFDPNNEAFDVYPYKMSFNYFKKQVVFEVDNVKEHLWRIQSPLICKNFFRRVHDDIKRWNTINTDYKVVISIPAGYNKHQRDVISNAARSAKLQVVQLITVTDASMLSYAFHNPYSDDLRAKDDRSKILVLDLGATSFNLGLYDVIGSKTIKRIGEHSDLDFGGFEFDSELLKYINDALDSDGYNVVRNKAFMRRMRQECERVKILLSTYSKALFSVTLDNGFYAKPITIEEFEKVTEGLCLKAMNIIKEFMKEHLTSTFSIRDVVLCGGSTGIRQLQELLFIEFLQYDRSAFTPLLHRDESVVQGAALRAAMLSPLSCQDGFFMNIQSQIYK